jgi:ankyrin repeat protein
MWGAVGYFDVDDKHLQAMDDYTFLAAVEENDQALVRSMLKRDATMMMTSARSDLMETPLQIAAREGNLSMVKLLVAYGADVQDEGGEEYVTALHEAAARGHTEVATFLLRKGAKPCTADLRNETPLLQAARGGHVEVVKLLLPHMSRQALDVQDRKGATALWHACQVGAADVVRVLLLAGADRSIASMEQGTPRQVAVQEGREAVLALLDVSQNHLSNY